MPDDYGLRIKVSSYGFGLSRKTLPRHAFAMGWVPLTLLSSHIDKVS